MDISDKIKAHHAKMEKKNKAIDSSLHGFFSYNPKTGKLYRIDNGKRELTSKSMSGYLRTRIKFDGVVYNYRLHRLAFFLMEGRWPVFVDHVNGVRDDNRWDNLREISPHKNQHNRKNHRNGFPVGVSKHGAKYLARLPKQFLNWSCDKTVTIGRFDTKEDAAKAIIQFCKEPLVTEE